MLSTVDGYVVVANYNSRSQSVIGGETAAVERAAATFRAIGRTVVSLPCEPRVPHRDRVAGLRGAPRRPRAARRAAARIPVVANLTGEPYASGSDARAAVLDVLSRQMAAPVQFAKGLQTLYDAGVRVFVEVGPKRALQGLAEEAFASDASVFSLFTNHPKLADDGRAEPGGLRAANGARRPAASARGDARSRTGRPRRARRCAATSCRWPGRRSSCASRPASRSSAAGAWS